jgi:type II secretory pathway pseudopilin PulG
VRLSITTSRPPATGGAAGFTILEVMIAMFVLVLAILAVLAAVASSSILRESSGEQESGTQILSQTLEMYRSLPLDEATAHAQSMEAGGPTAIPATMAGVEHLKDATLSTFLLGEAETEREFGLTDLDLDHDGVPSEVDADSEADDYRIVPIKLVLTWTTRGESTRTLVARTMLYPTRAN